MSSKNTNIMQNLPSVNFAFLGHVIFGEGIEVDPKKTDAVRNRPRPLTPIDIRSFFGLAGYYRRCVDEFYLLLLLQKH